MTTQLDVLQFPRSLQNSFRNKLLCSTTYSNAYGMTMSYINTHPTVLVSDV